MLKNKVGKAIRDLRKMIGMSQQTFADQIGVTRESVYSLEHARFKLSEKLAGRIQFATGVNAEQLMQGELIENNLAAMDPDGPVYTNYTIEWYNSHSEIVFSWKNTEARLNSMFACLKSIEGDTEKYCEALYALNEAWMTIDKLALKFILEEKKRLKEVMSDDILKHINRT